MASLKGGFTVWGQSQKEDFLSIVWLSMMSGQGANPIFFNKKYMPLGIFTHMGRRWGTPQNFFLAFTDELEKQTIIYKTVEVGQ